jgi:tetratricopeptide (TPR) repeat protein
LRRERNELEQSESCFQRLLTEAPPPHFASVDAGLRGFKARHQLAVVHQMQKRPTEAEAQWRLALEEQGDFLPGWTGLGELYLAQGRRDDLENVLVRLEGLPDGPLEGTVLRARAHLARKEFTEARALLEPLMVSHPRAGWPHVILSHVLLQEGRDMAAAEQVLRDILSIAPDNAEAKHNLGLLLRNQNRASTEFVAGALTLADLYQRVCTTDSDIHEHLPKLYELASGCRHVTEFGTRTGVSTTALLFAQPDTLVAYDKLKYPHVERLQALAGRTRFHFVQADVLHVEIEPTDLLFIDTWHVYEQLKEELRLHAGKARKYIVLHDTTTFGERGETAGHRGLWPAVEEFLAQGTFRLREQLTNNNGLTILEALPVSGPAAPPLMRPEPPASGEFLS